MNRRDIINFCNEKIFPQVDPTAWLGYKGELMEVVKVVEKWRRKNGWPTEMAARVENGFLFLNNKPVERIAMGNRNIMLAAFTDGASCYEGRILAQRETEYDF